jgi:hypothetical protein
MNIEESNKLIAEFMGLVKEPTEKNFDAYYPPFDGVEGEYFAPIELKYNTSWDWLMPVVEKIESLGFQVTIGSECYCVIQDGWKEGLEEIHYMKDNSKLLCTYGAVVEFIKWHNEQK